MYAKNKQIAYTLKTRHIIVDIHKCMHDTKRDFRQPKTKVPALT